MRYLGGKSRICKEISNIINNIKGNLYIEPFVGGAWVTQYVEYNKKYAYDINPYLISLYKKLQEGWIPPESITENDYKKAKNNEVSPHLRAFIGFGCSFAGKWFGGFARDNRNRNYCENAKNSLLKKFKKLKNVVFECKNYKELNPTGATVHCDPPYSKTTKYDYVKNFNTAEFWEYVRKWSKNNTVIISEYLAPDDFNCITEFKTKTEIRNKNNEREDRIERLFSKNKILLPYNKIF